MPTPPLPSSVSTGSLKADAALWKAFFLFCIALLICSLAGGLIKFCEFLTGNDSPLIGLVAVVVVLGALYFWKGLFGYRERRRRGR